MHSTGGVCLKMDDTCAFEKSPKGQIRRPTRPEHVIAFEFLKIHYEEDTKAETPIQKSDVYIDYEQYCNQHEYKPLVAADFGRILKSMFPNARDRRLGSRGSSKYCYVGVKRKSELNSRSASQNPYSPEDLCKAYQTVVCEWASTVLSRKLVTLEELAKYLLRNRFVQTRSCAALTITANLKDNDDLIEPLPMNKHRETQLKLQEKLREKLLLRQRFSRSNSADDCDVFFPTTRPIDSAFSSSSTTPDPEGLPRSSAAMQIGSAPGSSRNSPVAAMSVNSSACTSPIQYIDQLAQQKTSFGHSLPVDFQNGYRGGDEHIGSSGQQVDEHLSSGRTTPIINLYCHSTPQFQFDPRVHSAPATPMPNCQRRTMDSNQFSASQCNSLPSSARNTPVIPELCEAYHCQRPGQQNNCYGVFPGHSQSLGNLSRLEMGRNNSAFMPIKDSAFPAQTQDFVTSFYGQQSVYDQSTANKLQEFPDDHVSHNSSDELEINELLNIIDPPDTNHTNEQAFHQDLSAQCDRRPASVQDHFSSSYMPKPVSCSSSSSVIYSLLTASKDQNDHLKRFRHHSGPQLGYAGGSIKSSALYGTPVSSPPTTPNGKFRPVLTPNAELRLNSTGVSDIPFHLNSGGQTASAVPHRLVNNIAGTMSPPSQPLVKRKRQSCSEVTTANVSQSLTMSHVSVNHPGLSIQPPASLPASAGHHALFTNKADRCNPESDYFARRNLVSALSSPQLGSSHNDQILDAENGQEKEKSGKHFGNGTNTST